MHRHKANTVGGNDAVSAARAMMASAVRAISCKSWLEGIVRQLDEYIQPRGSRIPK